MIVSGENPRSPAAGRAVTKALAEVDIIGSDEVREAARDYERQITDHQTDTQHRTPERYSSGDLGPNEEDRCAYFEQAVALNDAREAFRRLARQDIAVDNGFVPLT